MKHYVLEILRGAASLLLGLGVTLRALLSRPVTVQYPRRAVPLPPGFRGHPVLVRKAGDLRCIACGTCSRACPSQCITLEGVRREGDTRRRPRVFLLDSTRCSLCGTCVDVCPAAALAYSPVRCAASLRREDLVLDLLTLPEAAP